MRVLVTVDQSLCEGPHLDLLCKCDFIASAHVKLLHVLEPIAWQSLAAYPTILPPAEIVDRERRKAATSSLKHVADTLKSKCVTESIESELREGDVVSETLMVSEEWKADLILVATSEVYGLEKFFGVDVSESVSLPVPRLVAISRRTTDC